MILVDVNVVFFLLIEGEYTPQARTVLSHDKDWVSARLGKSEFRNVLGMRIRRKILSLADAVSLMRQAELLIKEGAEQSSAHILQLAASSGCTAYDCEYIALAESMQTRLFTEDKQLLTAFPGLTQSLAAFTS